jgi:hypothetical protein
MVVMMMVTIQSILALYDRILRFSFSAMVLLSE